MDTESRLGNPESARRVRAPSHAKQRWALAGAAGVVALVGLVFLAPAFACSPGANVNLVTPQTAPPGAPVTIDGDLFDPNGRVFFHWNVVGDNVIGSVITDADGRFRATVPIPLGASPGTYKVVAVGTYQDPTTRAVVSASPAVTVVVQAAPTDGGGQPPTNEPPSSGGGSQASPGTSTGFGSRPGQSTPGQAANGDPAAVVGAVPGQPASSANQGVAASAAVAAPATASPAGLSAGQPAAIGDPTVPLGGILGPTDVPGQVAAADARIAEGVQPSLSFAPGRGNGLGGKALATVPTNSASMIAMVVAFGFALAVAGLLASDALRRRKVKVHAASPSARPDSST